MTKEPKLSFVIATRDRGDRIGRTLNTLIDQTEHGIEIIVVDDHSKPEDQTAEVVNAFNDERLRYIRIPDAWPAGIATARNFGNMYARAPYIAVADSDDLYVPERAEETLKAFEEHGVDVVYSNLDIVMEKTGEVKERHISMKPYSVAELRRHCMISHGTTAYRRGIAAEFPYNSFFIKGSDYDLFARLAVANKRFYYIPKVLMHYVVHGTNISGGGANTRYDHLIHDMHGWESGDREAILHEIIKMHTGQL